MRLRLIVAALALLVAGWIKAAEGEYAFALCLFVAAFALAGFGA